MKASDVESAFAAIPQPTAFSNSNRRLKACTRRRARASTIECVRSFAPRPTVGLRWASGGGHRSLCSSYCRAVVGGLWAEQDGEKEPVKEQQCVCVDDRDEDEPRRHGRKTRLGGRFVEIGSRTALRARHVDRCLTSATHILRWSCKAEPEMI